jgi:hypothetical protein
LCDSSAFESIAEIEYIVKISAITFWEITQNCLGFWLIREAENAFLQHRLTLLLIEEILSIDAGFGRREGSESPFDPQQFFAGQPFELSIE